jgi:hypothetical protein
MDRHEIKCIQKSNLKDPHNIIEFIGGVNSNGTRWKIRVERAIEGIESGKWEFYVNHQGLKIDVIISSNLDNKYLKTKNDDLQPNNLLNLPDCI